MAAYLEVGRWDYLVALLSLSRGSSLLFGCAIDFSPTMERDSLFSTAPIACYPQRYKLTSHSGSDLPPPTEEWHWVPSHSHAGHHRCVCLVPRLVPRISHVSVCCKHFSVPFSLLFLLLHPEDRYLHFESLTALPGPVGA